MSRFILFVSTFLFVLGSYTYSTLAQFGDEVSLNHVFAILPESPGANCANGGSLIASGPDFNGNGNLNFKEVRHIGYACNGNDGVDGAPGPNVDTSAATECNGNEVLVGNGSCVDISTILDTQEMFCETLGITKTVFITNQRFQANLFGEAQANFADCSGVTTGLEGADCICQEMAETEGLTGTYKAWLSDSVDSPNTRFTKSACPYVMTNAVTVADNWTDLTDGNLQNSIRIDQTGTSRAIGGDGDNRTDELVNTNTLPNGTSRAAEDCDDWTSSQNTGDMMRGGSLDDSDSNWTDIGFIRWSCIENRYFYCFEQ